MINDFIEWLEENGWKVILNDEKYNVSSNVILNKYQGLPNSFVNLLEKCHRVESNDETIWFLCGGDYFYGSEDAFKWNEFELMSLEAAQNDAEWKKEILEWWKDKLPIILSVRNGYTFYAIEIDNSGAIVKGTEPEFENAIVVANNFDDFLKKIMNKTIEL
ncbi:MAG: SMI1/KNR4 family protein [Lachnospiraceae bacterium]|nr:SMI1/KNR4 family protein [Lachnospiraceae bacterium]